VRLAKDGFDRENGATAATGDADPGNPCFGCGIANPQGMRLAFQRDDARRRIVGRFRLGATYQGGGGFIHGGIIATVLDEVMSKVSRFQDVRAVTAELHVEYLKPVPVDEELSVEGFATRRDGRQLYHEGEIRNSAGELLARGQGRFVVIDPARYAKSQGARPT
jgi:uncharacterized protein (TIGR00369 family)